MRMHYSSIVEGYIAGLRAAQAEGEVRDLDATVAAWALMDFIQAALAPGVPPGARASRVSTLRKDER